MKNTQSRLSRVLVLAGVIVAVSMIVIQVRWTGLAQPTLGREEAAGADRHHRGDEAKRLRRGGFFL